MGVSDDIGWAGKGADSLQNGWPVMNFELQKFFIGLLDFFAILLPSALLTCLPMGELGRVVLLDRHANLAGAPTQERFLLASCFLSGHVFIFVYLRKEFFKKAP